MITGLELNAMHPAPITTSVHTRIIETIEARLGLAVGTHLRAELDRHLAHLSVEDLATYARQLASNEYTAPIWQQLITALTINETYFMRNEHHYEILKQHLLPKIILKQVQNKRRSLRIWSVGCASGEEAYSIAILITELIPDIADWDIQILGTDLNVRAIDSARQGIYRQWAFRHTGQPFQKRYFDPIENDVQIKPAIHKLVDFRQHNVLDSHFSEQFDIIFCRHVLLYFNQEQLLSAEAKLLEALRPGGWLMVGQSEALRSDRRGWDMHILSGSPVYQKPTIHQARPNGNGRTNQSNGFANPATLDEAYEQAVMAIHEDQHGTAERHLQEVFTSEPENSRAHMLLAFILANRRDHEAAEKHLRQALRAEPLLADAHYIQAMIYLEEDNLDTACKALHAALYCDTHHALAAFTLGNLYAQEGALPDAYRSWRNACRAIDRLHPEDYISDISDLTAQRLSMILAEHLDD